MFPLRNLPVDYSDTHPVGLYVTIATSITAHQYLLHQSIQQLEGELPVVVHLTPINEDFKAHAPKKCLQVIHKESVQKSLQRLAKDLPRLFRDKCRQVFVSIKNEDVSDWTNYLQQHAPALKRLAEDKQYCIHFVIYSQQSDELCATLLAFNRLIAGISIFNLTAVEPYYQIIYWTTPHSVGSDQRFLLTQQQQQWAVVQTSTQRAERCDQHQWLFDKAIFSNSQLTPSSEWQLYDGMHALAQAAQQKRHASVCFSLRHNTPIHELVKTLHALRHTAGANLKIVVYEQDGMIRHSETQLLLDAGANILIPKNTPITHLLNIMGQLQSLRYERPSIDNIEGYLATRTAPQHKGFATITDFKQQVLEALTQPVSHALIRLHPHARLTPVQAVSHLNLQRHGDMFTVTDNEVYLFLYGCHPQMLLATLNHLFRMRWQDLFSFYVSATDATKIQQLLTQLATTTDTELPKLIGTSTSARSTLGAHATENTKKAAPTPYSPTVQPLASDL